MMAPILTLVAAAQAVATQPVVAPLASCVLTAPTGAAVEFSVDARGSDGSIRLRPGSGTIWPSADIVGSKASGLKPSGFAARSYAFAGSDEGFVVHFAAPPAGAGWQSATLYRARGRRLALPLAFGFCRPREAIPGEAGQVTVPGDAAAAAFDPKRWKGLPCSLVTPDGRRERLDYTWDMRNRVTLKAPGVWPGREMKAVRQVLSQGGSQPLTARFGSDAGPSGVEITFIEERDMVGSRLIQFVRLGSGKAPADDVGFAICGFPVVMSPVPA
jgi:hypothetical protein